VVAENFGLGVPAKSLTTNTHMKCGRPLIFTYATQQRIVRIETSVDGIE